MTSSQNDVIQKRLSILSSLERYIEESIYYRSYNDHMNTSNKFVIWNYNYESGKTNIP